MARENNRVIQTMEMSLALYSLIEKDGLKSAVPPHMHIDYKKDLNKLVLSGFKIDVIECKNWILEKKINMKRKPLQIDCSVHDFLRSVDCDEMSTDLFISNGITAAYTIENGDVVVFGSTENALAEAENRVNTALTSNHLIVEDQGVLQMPEWQDLKKQQELIKNSQKTSVLINLSQNDKVIVTGFREPVMEVSENLRDFVEKRSRVEEFVCVKSNAVVEFIKDKKSQDWQHFVWSDKVNLSFDLKKACIKLSGERSLVQPAMTFFKSLADALYTDTLIIKKAEAKKYFKEDGKSLLSMFMRENSIVALLQEDDMLEEEEDDFTQVPLGRVCSSCLKVYILQIGHVTLEVSCGDITEEKTDAIVNSSNKTFSLKSGVSKAILDAAGLSVERELLHIAEDANFLLKEIVTSSGNLPCKEIIHVVGCIYPADIKQKVSCVLELCEKHKFTSVAFPALGTGQGGANPADVADAMITAVVDFASKNKSVHVKIVKFLIFQTSMLADFHQNMIKISMKPKKVLFGRNKGQKNNILFEEIEPVVFQLCGETSEDLTKASAMINSLLNHDIMEVTVCDPAIAHFAKEELEMLSIMERELKVSVKTEQKGQDSVIRLKGLPGFISTAESHTLDLIRKVERNKNRSHLAILTSNIVEWQYQSGHNFKAFDVFTNCDLEEALNHQITCAKIKINNKEYEADIQRRVAKKGRQQIQLRRVQKDQSSLPSNWEDMKEQSVVLVKLTAGSEEFADVEKQFRITGLYSNIIKIERVQNRALWRTYMIKKEEMENKNKHTNNEKCLFHGTSHENTEQINHYGFNRSYAGKQGALYGNGSYFAVDPRYSAQGYSTPNANGHKFMYLARVLVGDFTQGKKGLPTPPPKSSKGVHRHDSVTDEIKNPSMFVIFNDVQAYPEYLITFHD